MSAQHTWVNIIHCYQPPTIEPEVLATVVQESYDPFFTFLYNNPHVHMTLNMNSCLTYLLHAHGYDAVLEQIKQLVERDQIELMDSAAFHPILPLIDPEEAQRQIQIHKQINHEFFAVKTQPAGFFLPECAYSHDIAQLISELGYTWIMLDEIAFNGTAQPVDPSIKHTIANTNLVVVFRDHKRSKTYVPDTLLTELAANKLPTTVITATDGELYWHRHKDIKGTLYKTTQEKQIQTATVSDYLATLEHTQVCEPVASHWDANEQELSNNIPYSLWQHPSNNIHEQLWKLGNLAYDTLTTHTEDKHFWSARLHFERGISSCTFWWASAQDLALFDHPAWKPDEVEKGALELVRVIRTLDVPLKTKLSAEKTYLHIKQLIWTTHWKHHANKKV